MNLAFTKMHSLGNDFIIVDSLSSPLPSNTLHSTILQKLTNRHLGVGCDQLLVLEPAKTPTTDFYCRIFNNDGSEAGMCANGIRCLAKFIHSRKISAKHSFTIATMARNVLVTVEGEQTTINVGTVDFEPKKIPILATEKTLSYNLETTAGTFAVGAVSVGNPHAVIRVTDLSAVDIAKIGLLISQHSSFPQQTNVNFMQIINRNNIILRTFERGTGETLACGSGASAAVAVGRIWQLLDESVTVHLHHGNLQVQWQDTNSPLLLTGPAVEIFNGIINLESLYEKEDEVKSKT